MRCLQVHSPSMNIEGAAQIFGAHGRALDMPAGEAPAPGRWPLHQCLRFGLDPQCKIEATPFFILPIERACTLKQIFQLSVCQLSIVPFTAVFLHIKVDRAIHFVCQSLLKDFFYHLNLLQDMAGGRRLDAWGERIKLRQHLMKSQRVLMYDLHRLKLLQLCFFCKLILSFITITFQMPRIGDVAYITYFITQMEKISVYQIKRDKCAAVAQVDIAVDGGTTYIHAHQGRM